MRSADLESLRRYLESGSRVLITGVRGIGKKTLVLQAAERANTSSLWFAAESFKTLPQVLFQSAPTLERALVQASESWDPQVWIVWDRFHLWDPETRRSLLSFSRSNPKLPKMLFLSDQDLGAEFGFDVPQIRIQPMNRDELRQMMPPSTSDAQLDLLLRKSGGVPLLVHLLSGTENVSEAFLREVLSDLPAQTQDLFHFLCWLDTSFDESDLSSTPFYSTAAITQLCQRLLVERMGSRVRASSFIRDLWQESLLGRDSLRKRHGQHVIDYLRGKKEHSLQLLRCSLQLQDFESLEESLSNIHLDDTELLRRAELAELAQDLVRALPLAADLEPGLMMKYHHLLLRCYFLCGQRNDGLDHAIRHQDLIRNQLQSVEEAQWAWLEILSQLNRANRHAVVQDLCRSSLVHLSGVRRALALVEWGVAQLGSNPLLAQKSFLEVLSLEGMQSEAPLWKMAQAFAAFQLGRSHDFLDNKPLAVEAYNRAAKSFDELHKSYFASVARLNAAWVLATLHKHSELEECLPPLEKLAERFGYTYVLAGCRLLRARLARYELKLGLALDLIDKAIGLLVENSPINAWIDALSEKCRILQLSGLRQKANETCSRLAQLQDQRGNTATQRIHDSLVQELQATLFEPEEFLDRAENSRLDPDFLFMYRAQLGLADTAPPQSLKSLPLGQLCELENKLLVSLRSYPNTGLQEDFWFQVGNLEKFLDEHSEVFDLRIALLLLQVQFGSNQLLDRAETLMQRWGCDAATQHPLQAWLTWLKNNGSKAELDLALMKCTPWDRNRWKLWIQSPSSAESSAYSIKTLKGETSSDELPVNLASSADLVFIEPLGEIYVRGKKRKGFDRKRSLRDLLSALFQMAPSSISKESLSAAIWGASYSPRVHDPRIYTLVQRARDAFGLKDMIIQGNTGYQWNSKLSFAYVRRTERSGAGSDKAQNLILTTLEGFKKQGQPWQARGAIQDATGLAEATLKRALSKMVSQGLILRKGSGPLVVYGLTASG
jgi:hypothetical protein